MTERSLLLEMELWKAEKSALSSALKHRVWITYGNY